jgi:hypothetical protein
MSAIDRDYWLDFAKDGVSKSIENREKAAEKLDTFLIWVWGIYTSVFALASLFNYMSTNIYQLIFVAQPILIIMLSRFFCTMVAMPSTNNDNKMLADPNDVASIIDSFKLIVKHKKRKLRIAIIFTFISIISISIALVGYNSFDPDKQIKRDIQTAKLNKDLHDKLIVPIKMQQSLNDSIKTINEYYDLQIQNLLKKQKLQYIENQGQKCLDTLKNL